MDDPATPEENSANPIKDGESFWCAKWKWQNWIHDTSQYYTTHVYGEQINAKQHRDKRGTT